MLYLIGGTPRSGKSIFSKRLSVELSIPYLSTDNIRPIVMGCFNDKEKSEKFPFERIFSFNSTDGFFEKYSGNEMLEADLTEARTIWPGTRSLIEHLIQCRMSYILEGVHLLPELVKDLENNKNIKIAFLIKTNKEKILEGLVKNKGNSDWILDNIKSERSLELAAESLVPYGKYFAEELEKYGFKYFNTEDDFSEKLKEAEEYLKTQR